MAIKHYWELVDSKGQELVNGYLTTGYGHHGVFSAIRQQFGERVAHEIRTGGWTLFIDGEDYALHNYRRKQIKGGVR